MQKSIEVLCKHEKLRSEIERGLIAQNIIVSSRANYGLLVDAPSGWAQGHIANLDMKSTLILSDNPCPEYCLDLLSYKPVVLLSNMSVEEIAQVLGEVLRGDQAESRIAPSSSLTHVERLTLNLIARGHTPKQVAIARGISEARVKNTIQTIYQKLGLHSRAQLALYYYGVWHVLEEAGWQPPVNPRY